MEAASVGVANGRVVHPLAVAVVRRVDCRDEAFFAAGDVGLDRVHAFNLSDNRLSVNNYFAWLKNHNVGTHHFTETEGRPETYNHLGFGTWVAYVGKRIPPHEDAPGSWSCRDSEDDALVALATMMGWKLWNEELAASKPLNAKSPNKDSATSG